MIVAFFSLLILVVAFSVFIVWGCFTDVLMKVFYALGFERAARQCVYGLSLLSENLLRLWGTQIEFNYNAVELDPDRPVLFVASHHSSLDICLLTNHLRSLIGTRSLSYVSRRGLDRGLPAISVYLRKHCYCLKGKSQQNSGSLPNQLSDEIALPKFAQRVAEEGNALVIFPEGVKPIGEGEHCRPFNRKGLRLLMTNMPKVQIVPITISGTGSFYTTPRTWGDVLRLWPAFKQCIKIELLPILPENLQNNVEEAIDLMQMQILSCYQQQIRKSRVGTSALSSRRNWIL